MLSRHKLPKSKSKTDNTEISDHSFSDEVENVKQTMNLASIFSLFHLLEQIHKKKKISKKKKTPTEQEFISHMETIIKLLVAYQRKSGTTKWSSIFHKYMCTSTDDNSFENFLIPNKMKHIENLLSNYIYMVSPITEENSSIENLTSTVNQILLFIRLHQLDPFSCLIGLEPSKDVIETTKSNIELSFPSTDKIGGNVNTSSSELLHLIIKWAAMDDAIELQKDVRAYAGKLRGTLNLSTGALILIENNKNDLVFGRYYNINSDGKTISVFLDPMETELSKVNIDLVYPLKTPTIQKIDSKSPFEMEKLVNNISDPLFHTIMSTVESKTFQYFQNQLNIDMDVIRKANQNQCSISELEKLTDAKQKLTNLKLLNEPPADLLLSLNDFLQEKISEFDVNKLFKPTKEKQMKQLKEFQIPSLITMHLQRYIGICESGLDQLSLKKRELMSGARKEKISEWWLKEIDIEVITFLECL